MWILIAWTTIYMWWLSEKRKIIESQWCASSIWGEINNYVFYALTSKNLKISESEVLSPDFYLIQLSWLNQEVNYPGCTRKNYTDKENPILCKNLVFSYASWDKTNIIPYKTLTVSNTCHQSNPNLWFIRSWGNSWEISYINMNKWFSPISNGDKRIFYMQDAWGNTESYKHIIWSIIIILCFNDECKNNERKEIAKRDVDWRTQTISLNKCKFYDNENPSKCKEREN